MDGWTRIRIAALGKLCDPRPEGLGWQWLEQEKGGYPRLQLVSPRGVVWNFRFKSGAWMRRADMKTKSIECHSES